MLGLAVLCLSARHSCQGTGLGHGSLPHSACLMLLPGSGGSSRALTPPPGRSTGSGESAGGRGGEGNPLILAQGPTKLIHL